MNNTVGSRNGASRPSNGTSMVPIGNRLRKLRRERSMTLSEAAKGTDLSVSFLSCLERGQAHASVAALQRLAVFYNTNVLSFFGGEQQAGKLVRPAQRIELERARRPPRAARLRFHSHGAASLPPRARNIERRLLSPRGRGVHFHRQRQLRRVVGRGRALPVTRRRQSLLLKLADPPLEQSVQTTGCAAVD